MDRPGQPRAAFVYLLYYNSVQLSVLLTVYRNNYLQPGLNSVNWIN